MGHNPARLTYDDVQSAGVGKLRVRLQCAARRHHVGTMTVYRREVDYIRQTRPWERQEATG
jgi:hypothetical protein